MYYEDYLQLGGLYSNQRCTTGYGVVFQTEEDEKVSIKATEFIDYYNNSGFNFTSLWLPAVCSFLMTKPEKITASHTLTEL